jgi:uncharacterized protein
LQDISGIPEEGQQLVNTYGEGRFRVSGNLYEGSILILPDRTLIWDLSDIEQLSLADLSPVTEEEPAIEILLVGCGANMAFISDDIRNALRQTGTVIDTMNTGAAARTYNVLMLEGRRVAAALIAL